jgi:hypothetical protein
MPNDNGGTTNEYGDETTGWGKETSYEKKRRSYTEWKPPKKTKWKRNKNGRYVEDK